MKDRRAPEVRTLLVKIKGRLTSKGKGISNADAVAELVRKHGDAIHRELEDIKYLGLMKLANEACNRSSGFESTAQIEMFEEYKAPKLVYIRVVDEKGPVTKKHFPSGSLTPGQARQLVKESIKPQPRIPERLKELARLADDMEPYKESESSTIDECWKKKTGG